MKDILGKIAQEINNNNKVAMAMVIKAASSSPGVIGSTMGVYEDGSIVGTVGGGILESRVIKKALECLETGESNLFTFGSHENGTECSSTAEIFINIYNPRPKLLIVGGGHVAYQLYKLGVYLDFAVSIFEDREEFCSKERFPEATELILGETSESLRKYNIDNNCYVIMVSRGHKQDEDALKEVVSSNAKYIGMIGSRKKVRSLFDNLRSRGISDELLEKVYSPIGIALGGDSVKEIAFGIMSEVLLVKNKGNLKHMKSTID